MSTAAGAPRAGASLEMLGRRLTGRLRFACWAQLASLTVTALAAACVALECVARMTYFPALRALEAGSGVLAAIAAALVYARRRPPAAAWRGVADRVAGEPGVFSALGADVRETLLSEVVRTRAESAAAALLGSSALPPVHARALRAVLAVLVGALCALIPGVQGRPGALDAGVQDRLLAEVRALDSAAAVTPADRELLRKAAASLEGRRLTADEARRIAEELGRSAEGRASREKTLSDALAAKDLLRDLAGAVQKCDPAAIDRALAALAERLPSADPRSREAAAAVLLDLAAGEKDEALHQALADAGRALAAGNGSGDAVRALGPPLARVLRQARAMRDVVVTLESASNPSGAGEGPLARSGARPRSFDGNAASGAGPPGPACAPGALPIPADFRSLARPGTSDETVLRRYFAVP